MAVVKLHSVFMRIWLLVHGWLLLTGRVSVGYDCVLLIRLTA